MRVHRIRVGLVARTVITMRMQWYSVQLKVRGQGDDAGKDNSKLTSITV
jgi:hypothetical protein